MIVSTLMACHGCRAGQAGVKCDLSEKPGASGKPTVTHQLKKYAVALAALVGYALHLCLLCCFRQPVCALMAILLVARRVDYDKIAHLASHERNVTRNHYMTTCADAMHR